MIHHIVLPNAVNNSCHLGYDWHAADFAINTQLGSIVTFVAMQINAAKVRVGDALGSIFTQPSASFPT